MIYSIERHFVQQEIVNWKLRHLVKIIKLQSIDRINVAFVKYSSYILCRRKQYQYNVNERVATDKFELQPLRNWEIHQHIEQAEMKMAAADGELFESL